MEVWIEVQENARYEVSNTGKIRDKKTKTLKKQYTLKNGYSVVSFYENGKQKNVYVHRIVACAFLGGSECGLEVNHKDGVKTNNNVSNLEWVTRSENILHCIKTIGRKPRMSGYIRKKKIKGGENMGRHALYLLRCDNRLTQQEMAERIGINTATYSLIEAGRRQGKYETWVKIQKEFNIPDENMYALMKVEEKSVKECE